MKIGSMKKIAALLAASMVLFSAAGCSRTPASSSSEAPSSAAPSSSVSVSSSKPASSSSVAPSSSEPEIPMIEVPDNTLKVTEAIGINDDVYAYLYIPDTQLDEPVVCAANYSDSKSYYAHYDTTNKRRNWKGEISDDGYGVTGALYFHPKANLDSRESLSPNVVIFGHNPGRVDPSQPYDAQILEDNPEAPKFAQLYKFLDEDFAKNHPYIFVSTETDNLCYQIIAVYWTESETEPYKYYSSNLKPDQVLAVAEDALLRSEWIYDGVELEEGDKFLTLSTCTYQFTPDMEPAVAVKKAEAYRFVVMAKLLEEGATGEATASITKNPEPKQPQV